MVNDFRRSTLVNGGGIFTPTAIDQLDRVSQFLDHLAPKFQRLYPRFRGQFFNGDIISTLWRLLPEIDTSAAETENNRCHSLESTVAQIWLRMSSISFVTWIIDITLEIQRCLSEPEVEIFDTSDNRKYLHFTLWWHSYLGTTLFQYISVFGTPARWHVHNVLVFSYSGSRNMAVWNRK